MNFHYEENTWGERFIPALNRNAFLTTNAASYFENELDFDPLETNKLTIIALVSQSLNRPMSLKPLTRNADNGSPHNLAKPAIRLSVYIRQNGLNRRYSTVMTLPTFWQEKSRRPRPIVLFTTIRTSTIRCTEKLQKRSPHEHML